MVRIGILGIGGVGGYIGALLTEAYADSEGIEVVLITRPVAAKLVLENGLRVLTMKDDWTIFPTNVLGSLADAGKLDVLIVCTKTYHLDDTLPELGSCITDSTLILPLLNGVDTSSRIREMYPNAQVLDGCIYIVARLLEPGVIKIGSESHSIFLGSKTIPLKKQLELESILQHANIIAKVPEDIDKTVWEKFMFISCIASCTTYYDQSIGEVLASDEHRGALEELLREFIVVARAHKVNLDDNCFAATLEKMEKLPYQATSSMHTDSKKGGPTEYKSLTEYVVNLGRQYGVETPVFARVLEEFRGRDGRIRS